MDKNEIVIFSEKIDAASAQKGFFVAPSFTRDAQAQAAKDARIVLLEAKQGDPLLATIPAQFHFLAQDSRHVSVWLHSRGSVEEATPTPINPQEAQATWNGASVAFTAVLDELVRPEVERLQSSFPSGELATGPYEQAGTLERMFSANELVVNGIDIERLEAKVVLNLRVIRPTVRSVFEVSKRGRALSLERVELSTGVYVDVTFAGMDAGVEKEQ